MKNKDKKKAFIYFCVWGGFALLAFLFPYTGDDWMWGSSAGIRLLQKGFAGYDGRYAGDLLVLLLTRCKVAQILAVSGALFGMAYGITWIVNRDRLLLFLVSAVLLLLLPREVMSQTLVWTSGFSNYVTSAMLLLVFFCLFRLIQERTAERKPKYMAAALILGVVNALFVEHITLVNLFLGMVLLIYTWVTNRKMMAIPVLFLGGALLGAFLMFRNGAYHNVTSDTDFLNRSIYLTYLPTLVNRMKENVLETILPLGVEANLVFHGLGAILMWRIARSVRPKQQGWRKQLLTVIRVIPAVYFFFLVFRLLIPEWNESIYVRQKTEILFVMVDFIAWLVFSRIGLERDVRDRLTMYFFTAAAIAAPLFVVTPIGARCLYGIYVLLALALVELIQAAFPETERDRILLRGTAAAGLAVFVFWGNIYGQIFIKEKDRLQSIKNQIREADGQEIVVAWERLPYQEYLQCADISMVGEAEASRIQEFKEFYGIPDTVLFDFEAD